ncbi:MAG: hypothetical protein AB1744_02480, partial [Candidatus Zixiibacteriota bacterium]
MSAGLRFVFPVVLLAGMCVPAASMELTPSLFDREQQGIRYQSALRFDQGTSGFFADEEEPEQDPYEWSYSPSKQKVRSPIRGFLYSLVVPGLGQFYYGSKIKPLLFLSAEAASWGLYLKWHSDGDDLTKEYEDFNDAHWSRGRYADKYLLWTYGQTDD